MNYKNREPKQLEIKREEHYDRVYGRQKQIMKRLRPLLNKSDVVEDNTEPYLYSPHDPLRKRITMKGKIKLKVFSNKKKKQKKPTTKKISQVRPDVLLGMS